MIFTIKVTNQSIKDLAKLLYNCSESTLIVSLIQENRDLEKYFNIENEIIYDNSDYLNETIDFEDVVLSIDQNLDIVPSSYKIKVESFDFNDILRELELLEYENNFVLIDDKVKYENLVIDAFIIENVDQIRDDKYILHSKKSKIKSGLVYGFLNEDLEHLKELAENIRSEKFIAINKSFFARLLGK